MKKTVRWILAIVVFIAVGLLMFGRISQILREKTGQQADMMHSLYSMEENTVDVLTIGSSHGYYAVQPNYLWNEYGIAVYDMCSPRQSVATSYYVLKEVLKYQSPKAVLLESYYFYFDGKYVSEDPQVQVRQAFDGLKCDEVKYAMMEDFFPDLTWKEKLSYYIPFIQYHSRWNDLRDYDFNSEPYLHGAHLDYSIKVLEDPGLPTEGTPIPEVNCVYFEKIQQLCEENEIELIVFAAPYAVMNKEATYMKNQGVNLSLESYLEEKGVPFYFYQKMDEVTFDFTTDFRDTTHLNTRGGYKISAHLGEVLTEEYEIPDRREDVRYQSWYDDYELYRAAEEKLLSES